MLFPQPGAFFLWIQWLAPLTASVRPSPALHLKFSLTCSSLFPVFCFLFPYNTYQLLSCYIFYLSIFYFCLSHWNIWPMRSGIFAYFILCSIPNTSTTSFLNKYLFDEWTKGWMNRYIAGVLWQEKSIRLRLKEEFLPLCFYFSKVSPGRKTLKYAWMFMFLKLYRTNIYI